MKKYKILSNTWRPQTFQEIVGQKYIIQAIINGLNTGRIHQTWLFSGKHGIGKTTIARILAKCLNCKNKITAQPCRSCDNCIEIEKGKSLDFIELDAASRTKVEEIKILLETIRYLPVKGRFKIYLIDEVHMLSKHSFNALLKTLEEPPKYIKFILATTEIEKIPQTILSRCLQFSLQFVQKKEIFSHLKKILKKEEINTVPEVLNIISDLACGSIRDALNMLELAISSTKKNEIKLKNVNKLFNICDKKKIFILVKNILSHKIKKVLKILDKIEIQNISYDSIMNSLINFFHELSILQIFSNIKNSEKCIKSIYEKNIFILSKSISFKKIKKYYKILINGKKNLKYIPNARIGLEMTIFQMYEI